MITSRMGSRPAEGVDKVSTPFQMEATPLGFHLNHSRSIASAGASLVGARAALYGCLRVFLPWRSYGKNDLK